MVLRAHPAQQHAAAAVAVGIDKVPDANVFRGDDERHGTVAIQARAAFVYANRAMHSVE
jgi:hypothetical protein